MKLNNESFDRIQEARLNYRAKACRPRAERLVQDFTKAPSPDTRLALTAGFLVEMMVGFAAMAWVEGYLNSEELFDAYTSEAEARVLAEARAQAVRDTSKDVTR